MANEAVLKLRRSHPVDFIVQDGVGIEKGALLVLTDPRTASGSTIASTGLPYAGIAAREKIASDGRTRLSVFTPGNGNVFDMKVNASEAVTAGEIVTISGLNLIRTATEAEIAAGGGIGKALETGAASEVIEVEC